MGQLSSQALPPLDLNPSYVDLIKGAMYGVTQEGTSARVFANAPYQSGGKTGTAQAVTLRGNEKYSAIKMDEYKRDHSLYEAFAPLDHPRVALAIIVENAGFGAEAAAPIARRVLDYLLLGIYPSEEDIAAVQRGEAPTPIGQPRRVADVPLPPAVGGSVWSGGPTTVAGDAPMEPTASEPVASAAASAASAATGSGAPASGPAAVRRPVAHASEVHP